ncbi:YfiT family bacillithiol transferase [Robiginitalea sp. SC105]|uniref:YfiT family bacillithiol transferase n=1 Tax=Robiginitalea sp. SC105 TaxID=2762332 RepID=UPI00163B08C8|nr:bacillithiol transferase BstA [Robiginitalea sp. SC105]MBC2839911.1 bacillithiol transferase BstA [Robiginitalea sp. SC105]
MTEQELESLRYPIGHFTTHDAISDRQLSDWIAELEALPTKLRDLVSRLTEAQLETPYRTGGWTVRQVVHHLADSHHNSYIRFKWGLTEDAPTIKAYDEKAWAALFDSRTAPIGPSLDHLQAVHAKLVYLLRGLDRKDLQRTFVHPDTGIPTTLEENVGRYAWHGNHHFAHIESLIRRNSW